MFSFPRVRFYSWIQLSVFAGIALVLARQTNEKKSLHGIWKSLLVGCGILTLWALVAGIVRYQGELHSKLLQIAKKQRNFARIVRESERAASWYFPVDETATPFSWYKGMAFFYSGNVSAAKAAYEDALEKNPYHIQLLNDLGTTLEQMNERERAAEIYQRALRITPLFPHTLLNISACYFNAGKKDSAFIYIDKLYNMRLSYQEKKSYSSYLPPILREKIYSDSSAFPEDVRSQVILSANDTAFVSAVYRRSKLKNSSFNQALTDSLRK
jgi:tetratricopeptide (TPR) repeat protein